MPIHGALTVGNDGSDQSGNWWAGVSLRHQNLTRHDDILSVEGQVALKNASMYAVSGSYLVPHGLGLGGTVGVYGGYSELDINDLVPGIGVSGMGRYAGVRLSQRLVETRGHRIELAAGQTLRWTTETLTFGGIDMDERSAQIAPYYAQLSWQQKHADALGGRTFAMVEGSRNVAGWLGASSDLDALRVGADATYTIVRAQVARLQALGGEGDGMDSRWTLFARVSGQRSDTALIAMEQFGLGGAVTVRGYAERELLGDSAAFGSLEVRTPVVSFDEATGWALRDRFQLVLFTDAGWASLRKRQPGEAGSDMLLSAGLGLRYAVRQNALLRFDWGFPIEKTYESGHGGRGTLNVQLQF
ncbi:MAG: BamA/TamA family outer membrane protein [Kiritimatiellaeota bacterium]|nr:BamA/TamA family outer membrane protein [Kiritimatiellota bacterium]